MEPADPADADLPPDNPEDWTDEQWIEWLKATDEQADAQEDDAQLPAHGAGKLMKSAGGQILGQAMLGMANAIYGRENVEVVIVAERDSDPEDDEPLIVNIDHDHPERSTVVVRTEQEPPQ
jgi:predicted alpha/beta hydrolase family esterase